MSQDWKSIAEGLARALRSRPCNCEKRWMDKKPEMVTTKTCSRCIELANFDDAVSLARILP